MAALTRMLPPAPGLGKNPVTLPNGTTYSCAVGATIDVLATDCDFLHGNGWVPIGHGGGRGHPEAAQVGPSSSRKTNAGHYAAPLMLGSQHVDTTLGKIVTWDGAAWRDITGASV
jgi:hypothetical protein